jgi:hypothetical protein
MADEPAPAVNFTPLDSLKECAARGHLALANAIKLFKIPGALALPDAIERLTYELSAHRELDGIARRIFRLAACHRPGAIQYRRKPPRRFRPGK